MADNDSSKLRYDDFVGHVQPDPANPVSTIMLSGFVGHGPEGHARIYPDPTLGTWYDVPEDDVVHSMPIPDSKLGGSYVWIKANAPIKPGTTAAAPAAMEGLPGAQAGAQPLATQVCDAQAFCANATRIGPPPRGWTHGGWVCAIPSLVACTTITFTPTFMAAGAPAGMGTGAFNPMLAAGAAPAGVHPNTAATQCVLPGQTQQTPCPGWQGTAVCTMFCWTRAFCPPPAATTVCPTQVLCEANGVFTPFGR